MPGTVSQVIGAVVDCQFGTDEPIVPWENDKPTVVALREIATGQITEESIKAAAIRSVPPMTHVTQPYSYADALNDLSDVTESFKETE